MLFTFIEEHKGSRIYSAGLWNVQKRLYTNTILCASEHSWKLLGSRRVCVVCISLYSVS